jgi:glycosyltransferase involved in cell wall biosynthesis
VQTGDGATEAARAIAAASASGRIHLAGVLDDDDLAAVYRGARASCSRRATRASAFRWSKRSLAAVPVVATAAPAIAEVAADAAVLVSGRRGDGARGRGAEGARRSVPRRVAARPRARPRCQFRWGVAAVETLSVYEEVLGEPFGVRSR